MVILLYSSLSDEQNLNHQFQLLSQFGDIFMADRKADQLIIKYKTVLDWVLLLWGHWWTPTVNILQLKAISFSEVLKFEALTKSSFRLWSGSKVVYWIMFWPCLLGFLFVFITYLCLHRQNLSLKWQNMHLGISLAGLWDTSFFQCTKQNTLTSGISFNLYSKYLLFYSD